MDINSKEENILSGNQTKIELTEMKNYDNTNGNGDNNKYSINDSDNDSNTNSDIYNKESTEIEDIPQEVLMYRNKQKEENKIVNKNYIKKPSLIDEYSNAGEHIGKKIMKTLLLNLNSYWLEILGSIGFIIYIFMIELVIFLFGYLFYFAMTEKTISIDMIIAVFKKICIDIGLKWHIFLAISQHLSIGFLCLTTFSNVFHEAKNIKKFYIINSIKVAIFYALTVIILKIIIKDALGGMLKNAINEFINDIGLGGANVNKLYELCDILINILLIKVSNLIATY